MTKQRIQEIIVVEGKNDTANLKRFYDCETIETHGIGISSETIERIRHAAKTRGVIVFTDPDSPGNRIRSIVNEAVNGCKNAYIDKARARTSKKVGIEHAGQNALAEALENLVTFDKERTETVSAADFYELGLSGSADSAKKREYVGRIFHLGNGTANTMRHRVNDAGIEIEEIREVLKNYE